jgi:lipoprotein-anchoring transpeptidase ErfK/SrfK
VARRRQSTRTAGSIAISDLLAIILLCVLIALGTWVWLGRSKAPAPLAQKPTSALAIVTITNTAPPSMVAKAKMEVSVAKIEPAQPAKTNLSRATNAPSYKAGAILNAQVALDRLAISPGSIDGVMGSQTRAALRVFQEREGVPITGELDDATSALLTLAQPVLRRHVVTELEVDALSPVPETWLGKSERTGLGFESLIEMLAERSHAQPALVRRLNPNVVWTNAAPFTEYSLPFVERARCAAKAASIRIQLAARTLQAFDPEGRLLAHFPCSIASRVEKRPVGELRVVAVAPNPNYTFDPELFPESAEGRELGRKLILPPGPNNPVGTVWIGLDRPGYGIHGTPRPEEVGRTESHGCFRLANWNAEHLLTLISIGTSVMVEP